MANNKKYVGDVDSGLDVTNMYNTNASLDTSTGDNTLKTNYGSSGMQTYPIRTLLPSQDEIDIRKGIAKERGHTAQVARLEYREKKMKYNQEKRAGKFEGRQEKKLAKLKSREAAGKLRGPGKDRGSSVMRFHPHLNPLPSRERRLESPRRRGRGIY